MRWQPASARAGRTNWFVRLFNHWELPDNVLEDLAGEVDVDVIDTRTDQETDDWYLLPI